MQQRSRRLIFLRLTILLFVLYNLPTLGSALAAADAPAISVAPVWHPGLQLTSVLPGDIRFADAAIYVTTSVPFWATELSCTVTASVLQAPTDGSLLVNWGPNWGANGTDSAFLDKGLNPTTGVIVFSATRLGNSLPLGSNGVTTTFLLATLHFQVKTTAGTSPLTCTSSFLDRNGASVFTATYSAPPSLTVISGSSISGSIAYQGRTVKNGISVQCAGLPPVTTSTTGQFTFTNVRTTGNYDCQFQGTILAPLSVPTPGAYLYLHGMTVIHLGDLPLSIQPVTLFGGDLNGDGSVDALDLGIITSNFYGTGNKRGDINGDGQTNKADLAILGANFNMNGIIHMDHLIYGFPRSISTAPDNRIWLGGLNSSAVTQFVAGTNRDFWPALSPDGTKIAFTRLVGTNHVIFVQPVSGSAAVQLTPTSGTNSQFQNFAPSWSPDGSKIAFVCSQGTDWLSNTGSLCVVDSTGKNFQNLGQQTSIFPPSWVNNNLILYGSGTPSNIWSFDLSNNSVNNVSGNIPDTADMPVFRNGIVFYRYNNAVAVASYTQGIPIFGTNGVSGVNDYVKNGSNPATGGVDWFGVSPAGDDIVYTDAVAAIYGLAQNDSACPSCTSLAWSQSSIFLDNQLTNPTGTNRYGERNTADWQP